MCIMGRKHAEKKPLDPFDWRADPRRPSNGCRMQYLPNNLFCSMDRCCLDRNRSSKGFVRRAYKTEERTRPSSPGSRPLMFVLCAAMVTVAILGFVGDRFRCRCTHHATFILKLP
jgi:hypothetical protein